MSRQLGTYDPVFGYRFVPGLRARVEHEGGGYLVRTNQVGFRSEREFTPSKPSGTFRVLLFGDSFAAGMGVSNRDRFGELLETILPGLEVFNFALPGGAPDTQYLVYREAVPEIEHDLVVITVWVQNIRRVVARYRSQQTPQGGIAWAPKPYFRFGTEGSLELHNSPVPRDAISSEALPPEDRRFQAHLVSRDAGARIPPRAKGLLQRAMRYDALPSYKNTEDPDWRLMKAILERWTSELSVPSIIMPIPMHWHLEKMSSPKHYQRRFRELSTPPARLVHDPLVDLMGFSASERRNFRFEEDTHPTRAYHRALADSLANPVRQLMMERQPA